MSSGAVTGTVASLPKVTWFLVHVLCPIDYLHFRKVTDDYGEDMIIETCQCTCDNGLL